MNDILTTKEIQYEEIQTEYGIFTSNTHLGLTAQEVYEKWLYDKENPQPVKSTLEEEVGLLKEEISQLQVNIAMLTSKISEVI